MKQVWIKGGSKVTYLSTNDRGGEIESPIRTKPTDIISLTIVGCEATSLFALNKDGVILGSLHGCYGILLGKGVRHVLPTFEQMSAVVLLEGS